MNLGKSLRSWCDIFGLRKSSPGTPRTNDVVQKSHPSFALDKDEVLLAILTLLLPDMFDEERLETYTNESATVSLDLGAIWESDETDVGRLSLLAAKGCVLPLLVFASFKCLDPGSRGLAFSVIEVRGIKIPDVESTSAAALDLLDDDVFKENLKGVFSKSRRVPAGPTRWFYALATSSVCFPCQSRDPDQFWIFKSRDLVWALLSLSGRLSTSELGPVLYDEACSLNVKSLSEWEVKGWAKLQRHLPEKTLSSILAVVGAKIHWKFSSAHDEISDLMIEVP